MDEECEIKLVKNSKRHGGLRALVSRIIALQWQITFHGTFVFIINQDEHLKKWTRSEHPKAPILSSIEASNRVWCNINSSSNSLLLLLLHLFYSFFSNFFFLFWIHPESDHRFIYKKVPRFRYPFDSLLFLILNLLPISCFSLAINGVLL